MCVVIRALSPLVTDYDGIIQRLKNQIETYHVRMYMFMILWILAFIAKVVHCWCLKCKNVGCSSLQLLTNLYTQDPISVQQLNSYWSILW